MSLMWGGKHDFFNASYANYLPNAAISYSLVKSTEQGPRYEYYSRLLQGSIYQARRHSVQAAPLPVSCAASTSTLPRFQSIINFLIAFVTSFSRERRRQCVTKTMLASINYNRHTRELNQLGRRTLQLLIQMSELMFSLLLLHARHDGQFYQTLYSTLTAIKELAPNSDANAEFYPSFIPDFIGSGIEKAEVGKSLK